MALRLYHIVWALLAIGVVGIADSGSIEPPKGNKLSVKLKARGVQVYLCEQNLSYVFIRASASLYDINDLQYANSRGKHYFLPRVDGQGGSPTWSYFDAEKKVTSTVTGKIIGREERPGTIQDLLLQATSHSGPGDFDKVSYISRSNNKGGTSPSSCNTVGQTVKIQFESLYEFYVRETAPWPHPSLLSIPEGHLPVASYFGEGTQTYSFNGSAWLLLNASAQLSSVPGQEVIGRHYFLAEPDENGGQPTWETFIPASRLTARIQNRVVVDTDSIPWLSLQATSSDGGPYLLASISYVQRLSTSGGIPPSSAEGAKIGEIRKSPYTAIYWFYALVKK